LGASDPAAPVTEIPFTCGAGRVVAAPSTVTVTYPPSLAIETVLIAARGEGVAHSGGAAPVRVPPHDPDEAAVPVPVVVVTVEFEVDGDAVGPAVDVGVVV
jgi:hypothetical protein